MAEYVTISKFAKMANKSRQAIYRRINTDLKPYIIKESNKLKINVDAIYAVDTDIVEGYSKKSVAEVTDDENASNLAALSVTATDTDVTVMVNLLDKKEKQISDLLEIIKQQNKTIEILMAKANKQNFIQKLISRKKGKIRDIEINQNNI